MSKYSLRKHLLNEAVIELGDRTVSLSPLNVKSGTDILKNVNPKDKSSLSLLANILMFFRDEVAAGNGAKVGTDIGEPIAEQVLGGSQTNVLGDANSVFSDVVAGDPAVYYSVKSINDPDKVARQNIYFSKVIKRWVESAQGNYDPAAELGERASGGSMLKCGLCTVYPNGSDIVVQTHGPWSISADIINKIQELVAKASQTPRPEDAPTDKFWTSGAWDGITAGGGSGTVPSHWKKVMGHTQVSALGGTPGSEEEYRIELPSGQYDEPAVVPSETELTTIRSGRITVRAMTEEEQVQYALQLQQNGYTLRDFGPLRDSIRKWGYNHSSRTGPSSSFSGEKSKSVLDGLHLVDPTAFPKDLKAEGATESYYDRISVPRGSKFQSQLTPAEKEHLTDVLVQYCSNALDIFTQLSDQIQRRRETRGTLGVERSRLDKVQANLRKMALAAQYDEARKEEFIKKIVDAFGDDILAEVFVELSETGFMNESKIKGYLISKNKSSINRIWETMSYSVTRSRNKG